MVCTLVRQLVSTPIPHDARRVAHLPLSHCCRWLIDLFGFKSWKVGRRLLLRRNLILIDISFLDHILIVSDGLLMRYWLLLLLLLLLQLLFLHDCPSILAIERAMIVVEVSLILKATILVWMLV